MRMLRLVLVAVLCGSVSTASAQGPTRDPRAILGRPLREIAAGRHVAREERSEVAFADGLVVRLAADGTITAMALPVPAGTTCDDIPAWLGLPAISGSFPLRRADGCDWPARSLRHVLAPGLQARLERGVITVRRAPEPHRAPP